ncbi:MAG: ATP-binding protein [Chitinophagaceae bacterium]
MQPVTIDELREIVALTDLPDEHLQWILDHSEYREYADGGLIARYGDPAEVMWFCLLGKVAFYMYLNGRQVYYFTFENNDVTKGVGGLMPYSRMTTYPGYSYASGDVKLLRLNKKCFAELELLNPDFIQRLIGIMTERAKAFATTKLQMEKVNALGILAAGIAHELNNPAAAISSISGDLVKKLKRNYELTKSLLQCKITPGQLQNIFMLVEKKERKKAQNIKRTMLQCMTDEDELGEWLQTKGVNEIETAEAFSDFGFTIAELEIIYTDLGEEAFTRVIPWLENSMSSQKIIKDLGDASGHISNLVASIKSHVHMDKAIDLQDTNIHQGIENTLTLLGFKLREKNININRKFNHTMPDVPAYVSELNQVWTNLIDNAIFALEKNGELTIETSSDNKHVKVCIQDNGTGIPKEILSQIFDPFFTTKKVGEGSGIGLDIVNRIVKRHNGEIKVSSEPGKTAFTVYIPLVQKTGSN